MSDLKAFQRKLDASQDLRAKFLRDLPGTMKSNGIALTSEQESKLENSFAEQRLSAATADPKAKYEVGGSIGFKVTGGGDKMKAPK